MRWLATIAIILTKGQGSDLGGQGSATLNTITGAITAEARAVSLPPAAGPGGCRGGAGRCGGPVLR